ncbi:hypothetical protein [Acetobacter estunensis]|uniref:hypothetical protein n=1 Tax=Acetobacter estunensis TaxID=104097 RepID=UPI001C2CF0DC|nr:hypothetical protein [Acetobacter estunensis]MBV1838230.1 hypothetical protein [Acetobacter estunensis]
MEYCGIFIWPPHFSPETDIPFPAPAAGESLDPATVPLAALVTLARALDGNGRSESDLLSAMRKACGMGRMGTATRARLEKALTQARSTPACQTNKEAT